MQILFLSCIDQPTYCLIFPNGLGESIGEQLPALLLLGAAAVGGPRTFCPFFAHL